MSKFNYNKKVKLCYFHFEIKMKTSFFSKWQHLVGHSVFKAQIENEPWKKTSRHTTDQRKAEECINSDLRIIVQINIDFKLDGILYACKVTKVVPLITGFWELESNLCICEFLLSCMKHSSSSVIFCWPFGNPFLLSVTKSSWDTLSSSLLMSIYWRKPQDLPQPSVTPSANEG